METTFPDWPEWPFPDGPKVCPFCGGETQVAKRDVLLGEGFTTKGGGKPEWRVDTIRYCPPCLKKIHEERMADHRAGNCYDLKELIAALEEDREPRMECELHPDEYPKVDRNG